MADIGSVVQGTAAIAKFTGHRRCRCAARDRYRRSEPSSSARRNTFRMLDSLSGALAHMAGNFMTETRLRSA